MIALIFFVGSECFTEFYEEICDTKRGYNILSEKKTVTEQSFSESKTISHLLNNYKLLL